MLEIPIPDESLARAAGEALRALETTSGSPPRLLVDGREVELPREAMDALREILGHLAAGRGVRIERLPREPLRQNAG